MVVTKEKTQIRLIIQWHHDFSFLWWTINWRKS